MKNLFVALALIGMLSAPSAVQAQTVISPSVAFHNDFDFGVGAHVTVPLADERLAFAGSFTYFFPSSGGTGGGLDYWETNADLLYRIGSAAPVQPFLLGGINIARVSVDVDLGTLGRFSGASTEYGLNLGGGIAFPAATVRPMVGAKIQIDGGDGFVLFGGVGFPLG